MRVDGERSFQVIDSNVCFWDLTTWIHTLGVALGYLLSSVDDWCTCILTSLTSLYYIHIPPSSSAAVVELTLLPTRK